MKRLRAHLTGFSSAVAALLVLTIAVPRAGLYYHEHVGGDRAHVHPEDESGVAELLADYWQHRHGHDHTHLAHAHHHLTSADPAHPSGSELERDDRPSTGHWHSQDFFQRAVAPALFAAQHAESVQVAEALPEPAPVDRPALPIRVRGPPRPA
jgi:hypothetical protein